MSGSTKIGETTRRGLDLVNPKLAQQYEQIVALLRRRLGDDHALLLAEPVSLSATRAGTARVAWFAAADGDAVPLTSLGSSEAEQLNHKVELLLQDIRILADALEHEGDASRELGRLLRDAIIFPGGDSIWSLDGRPVLVDWGYRKTEDSNTPVTRSGMLKGIGGTGVSPQALPLQTLPTSTSTPKDHSPLHQSPPDQIGASRGGIIAAVALWLVFVGILFALGDRLLRACAIGDGWLSPIAALLPQHCPRVAAEPDGALDSLRVAVQVAEGQVRAQEIALARRIATCQHSCPAPVIQRVELPRVLPPVELPRVEPSPAEPPRISEDISSRLDNVERGKHLELTLAWEGPADLDLHVICPDRSRIAFNSKEACGGRLVADLNSSSGSSVPRPIEHIIWDDEPTPRGEYKIETNLYDRHGDARSTINYRLVLSQNGRVIREHEGELGNGSAAQNSISFMSPIIR
jgi:hypothetical protein